MTYYFMPLSFARAGYRYPKPCRYERLTRRQFIQMTIRETTRRR